MVSCGLPLNPSCYDPCQRGLECRRVTIPCAVILYRLLMFNLLHLTALFHRGRCMAESKLWSRGSSPRSPRA
jgi:hypothetical protein